MKGKNASIKSNLTKVDATPSIPDDELPELTKAMADRATIRLGGIVLRGPRKRGRPVGSGKKEPVYMMLDRDLLARFRATGPGWQTRINDTLRGALEWNGPVRKLGGRTRPIRPPGAKRAKAAK